MVVVPGKNFEGQRGFPTPNAPIEDLACRTFRVPANDEWLGVLMGAVELLTHDYAWYNWGELSIEDTVDAWYAIVQQSYAESFAETCPTVPAPYWDTSDDVDDSLPDDSESWYGEVTDPDAAPDELDFVENAAIWLFTGFIAYSGNIGAAIFFHTIAPKFVLAFKKGDVRQIIRIVIDAVDYGTVDTDDYADEIITQVVVGDPEIEGHDITLVQMALP